GVMYGVVVLLVSLVVLAVAFYGARTIWRVVERRRPIGPVPAGPPIERIAAELRRLLWAHDRIAHADDPGQFARRLWALETAIAHRAGQAARALGLHHPSDDHDRRQLRHLLRQLADEGLVLPRAVALMAH
ncbi:MAG TPA: hypothetical protein VK891_09560, partial [Euzebyales bacterium]|nr:hypothetical protein [Euzebyales bacterium]